MRAITRMEPDDGTPVTITLQMNMREVKDLQEGLKDIRTWPVSNLKTVLRQSIDKAIHAYSSDNVIDPSK